MMLMVMSGSLAAISKLKHYPHMQSTTKRQTQKVRFDALQYKKSTSYSTGTDTIMIGGQQRHRMFIPTLLVSNTLNINICLSTPSTESTETLLAFLHWCMPLQCKPSTWHLGVSTLHCLLVWKDDSREPSSTMPTSSTVDNKFSIMQLHQAAAFAH